ncbi:MAG: hypothetical protein ACAI38_01080 [Myxococcota bacterium]
MVRVTRTRAGDGLTADTGGRVQVRADAGVPVRETRPHPRHTRGVQTAQLRLETPAPSALVDDRPYEVRDAEERLARAVGLPPTARGPAVLGRVAGQLDVLREQAQEAERDIARMRAVLDREPGLAERFHHNRLMRVPLANAIDRAEEELRRVNADPWARERYGPEREALVERARQQLRDAEAVVAEVRPLFGSLDPDAVIARAEAVMQGYEDLGRGLAYAVRTHASSPEVRRLVFEENLFGRALDAFDAGRALARTSRANDIYLHAATGAQAMALNGVGEAIRAFGAETWPLVTEHRVVERLAAVQRDLVGNWEGLYQHRFELTPDQNGLTQATVQIFNRLASPEDPTFYVQGNKGVLAPLQALMELPPGPVRDEMVARLRQTELVHTLFQRMATRMSDGGGGGLQTSGSSQFGPVGEALNALFTQVPELRDTFYEPRYSIRLPEEVNRLPARWSIADWVRANNGWDAPFWTYDGLQKGANIRAFQELAPRL